MQHDKRQMEIMTTREDESMNLYHQSPQLLKIDSETTNDEVAVGVPLCEETAEMSGENGQGWITVWGRAAGV